MEEAGARISDASGKCLLLGYSWTQPVLAVLGPTGMAAQGSGAFGGGDVVGYAGADMTDASGRCLLGGLHMQNLSKH